jgi:hypothetical protein
MHAIGQASQQSCLLTYRALEIVHAGDIVDDKGLLSGGQLMTWGSNVSYKQPYVNYTWEALQNGLSSHRMMAPDNA